VAELVYYAIGDVHGEAHRLARLHDKILDEIDRHRNPAAIIHLGDLIDRGPMSRAAVEQAIALHRCADDWLEVVTLRGNHEQMLIDAIDDANPQRLEHWIMNGGDASLLSYDGEGAAQTWRDTIDAHHIEFLQNLPTLAYDEDRRLAFVHGGIDPARFPECADELRIWTRSPKFFDTKQWPDRPELDGLLVVHGHTPTDDLRPFVDARRVNIDTGAVFGGPLTCAVLAPNEPVRFLYVYPDA
jgi:serine/threonine protein phosphatase 1